MDQIITFEGYLNESNNHLHSHPYHQILVSISGLMTFQDQYAYSVLYGKHGVFIPAGFSHRAMQRSSQVFFRTIYFSCQDYQNIFPENSTYLPSKVTSFKSSSLFQELLKSVCFPNEEKPFPLFQHKKEPYMTTIRLLFLLLSKELETPSRIFLPQSDHPKLQPIIEYIEQSYDREISLQELEQNFFMSHRTISRLFQQEIQMTPFQYIQLRRIFQSTILLATTRLSILQISLKVGYQSLSSFYQAFQKIIGQSPKAYRNSQK
jgi:AraC-like DNA-binding protein